MATVNPQVQQKTGVQDVRLLLNSLENASFDEAGAEFVGKSLAGQGYRRECTDEEILRLALVAQQHGLLDRSLEILAWLNSERPACEQGWQAHLELLQLLGRSDETAALLARMSCHVSGERLAELRRELLVAAVGDGDMVEEAVTDPFTRMHREADDLRMYLDLFRGREDAFARQWADRQQEKQGYVPVQRPLQAEDIREHLQGRKTYGIYLLTGENNVHTGVLDIDLVGGLRDMEKMKAEKPAIKREALYLYQRIRERAAEAGLVCLCELSGGKGYHFWFPAAAAVPAAVMKKAMQALVKDLAADVKCFGIEVFPKQEKVSGKGYGNLVKLPLGVHRGTGRNSRFIPTVSTALNDQLAYLRQVVPAPPENFARLAEKFGKATVIAHPRQAAWAAQYPELAMLGERCAPLGQIMAMIRSGKELPFREEKILLGVLAHLPRARLLLHHLCGGLPEYNRPLLDYKISRVRGTVLGCKRIHSLLDGHGGDLPCTFNRGTYPHPLLHLPEYTEDGEAPIAEKVTNLQDALVCLQTAIEQIRRFL